MPWKDKSLGNARRRELHAKRKLEDPLWVAKRAEQQAVLHERKMREDAAYKAKRKENYDRWHALYGKESARNHSGYMPLEEWLQACEVKRQKSAAYMRAWSQTEKGQRARTARSIKKRCGLTIEEYDRTYDEQLGLCRICGVRKQRYGKDRLVVDHCHKTGKFRALLCSKCNCAIGLFEENEEIAHKAIQYLREVLDK